MDEKIREQRSRFPRAALLRTALVSDARDVEMRPFESLREFAQERRRRDRAAFTAADVGEIRKITLQLLSVLFRDRQMPGAIFGACSRFHQLLHQRVIVAHASRMVMPESDH